MSMLSASGIVAGYGAHDEVLKQVDLEVGEGELVVLIGPNGAGKSTLLKAIAGLVRPREGRILLAGQPIHGLRPREVARHGLAFVPQEANVFPSLTVEENLEMGGYLERGEARQRMAAVFDRLPILAARRAQAARSLSGGQRQTLAVGMALMLRPRLLLLDEPSAGLSPAASSDLFDLVKALHSDGMTIAMVEQNALEALRIADRAYLLVDGRNARDGVASELVADPTIREAFLGG
ncbi:MAG: ABC transporter ATP-binding protein [Alphaproteobacteria bacterium]|jgi:branched-chain amino acid transport system ATP-binding protein/neutral amino acid transport system ATP-binding protein